VIAALVTSFGCDCEILRRNSPAHDDKTGRA